MVAHPYTLRQMLRIVWAMGWSDFLLKYRGSVLGYLWSFLVPMLKFLVILYIFSPFVRGTVAQYPLYLFFGVIVFEHFATASSACISVLIGKAGLIQKVLFPRILLILAVGWMHVLIFLTHFAIFVVLGVVYGDLSLVGLWYLAILVVQMTLLALGVGMLLSAYSLKYQDIRHLWEVTIQILFWLTPVAYVPAIRGTLFTEVRALVHASFGGLLQGAIRLQPLSVIMDDARRVFLYTDMRGMPSVLHIVVVTGICGAVFAAGTVVFQLRSRYFLQEY